MLSTQYPYDLHVDKTIDTTNAFIREKYRSHRYHCIALDDFEKD